VTLRLHVDSYLNVDFCLALFTATVHVKMPIAKTPVSATLEGAGQSVSWADQMDDLEASEITADNLPEPRETVNGDTRTVVSYRVDEGGKIKKVTQVYQEVRQQVPKAIARRRTWKKFGEAEKDNPKGPDQATTVIADDVYLTLTTNKEQLEHHDDDPLKKLSTKSMVTCRICKGDHWTTKCPYKDTLGPSTIQEMEEGECGAAPTFCTACACCAFLFVLARKCGDVEILLVCVVLGLALCENMKS
jgi:hypothetical protein